MAADAPEKRQEGASEEARRWAAHEREIAAARAADAEAARRQDAAAGAHRTAEYDNRVTAWIGIGIALLLLIGGYILVDRLLSQSALEDCVLAHRSNCATTIDIR